MKPFTSSRKSSKETVSQQLSIISIQCNTDNRAIIRITIKDNDETPTLTEVKDEKQPHILEIETHAVEINVGSVEVIDIQELNALQRMQKVTSVQFAETEICQLLKKKTTLQTQHFWTLYQIRTKECGILTCS